MRHLYLLRHAKSSWNEPALKDFDRPLAPRGWNTAPLMGDYMEKQGYKPDCILCSPAMRTRETLEMIQRHLNGSPEVFFNDSLYHASASGIIDLIRTLDGRYGKLLVIGHNPGIQELALLLTGRGPRHIWQAMWAKYPTAALAVLNFDLASWSDLKPRQGELEVFQTPKKLQEQAAP